MRWDLPGAVLGVLSRHDGWYYEPHRTGGRWWIWIMWIGGFFVFMLVIYLLVYGLRNKGRTLEPARETPLDLLKKRYAKGEITSEEYEQMKRELEA